MVDIHSHILPGIDDGAKDWDTAVGLCRAAAQDGVTRIVATPHANDRYKYDRAGHSRLRDELQQRVGDAIQIRLGCDFHLSVDNIKNVLADHARFVIDDTKYLLVEFPDYFPLEILVRALERIAAAGLTPVITHPERNPVLQKNAELLAEFAGAGWPIQVTANSVTGYWGKAAEQFSRKLLESQIVHVIASDCHDLKHRTPVLSAARQRIAELAGEEVANALVDTNPAAIVAGQPLPYLPAVTH